MQMVMQLQGYLHAKILFAETFPIKDCHNAAQDPAIIPPAPNPNAASAYGNANKPAPVPNITATMIIDKTRKIFILYQRLRLRLLRL